jgi:hypothetical protein
MPYEPRYIRLARSVGAGLAVVALLVVAGLVVGTLGG